GRAHRPPAGVRHPRGIAAGHLQRLRVRHLRPRGGGRPPSRSRPPAAGGRSPRPRGLRDAVGGAAAAPRPVRPVLTDAVQVAAIVGHGAVPRLKAAVIEQTGLAYYRDKDDVLAARVVRRLAERGCTDCGDYLDLIRGPGGAEEFDALIAGLTVG